MKVLVTAASRHGSTREIGQVIAEEIRASGIDASYHDLQEVGELSQYDAVVLGSAVYVGNWLKDAQEFVQQHRESLSEMPVWLFSSGPIGEENPKPAGDPDRIPSLMETTRARGHRVFTGKLDPRELGFRERLIVNLVHAPGGDFREWEAIREWAREIARACSAADGE